MTPPIEQDTTAPPNPGADVPVISRALPWVLLVGGLVGLSAATALLVEKIRVLADPDHVPACSFNPVLSCVTVMMTPQAEVFGIPNPSIGVSCVALVPVIGAPLLGRAGGTEFGFRRWFWLGMQEGCVCGVGCVHWIVSQCPNRSGAVSACCMVVWAVRIALAG